MEKYLVDTTVLIDHLRNKRSATLLLGKEEITISQVTIAELIQGAKNKADLVAIEKLIKQFDIKWGSPKISKLAINLLKKYFLKFNLQFLDAIIAAIAIENNLVLVTDNIKHFKFIPHLKVIPPMEIISN